MKVTDYAEAGKQLVRIRIDDEGTREETLSAIADRLGRLKAEIAELSKTEKLLKDALVESGAESVEGDLFRVTVSHFDRCTVDYKAVVEKLGLDQRTLRHYTTHTDSVRVNVRAKTEGK
jgi:hypothetical protein